MAKKKAAGSAKNLRDSNPNFLGVKVTGGQAVDAGGIIIRQQGAKYVAGQNVYFGKDFTIHASIPGVVEFDTYKKRRFDGSKYTKTRVSVKAAG